MARRVWLWENLQMESLSAEGVPVQSGATCGDPTPTMRLASRSSSQQLLLRAVGAVPVV